MSADVDDMDPEVLSKLAVLASVIEIDIDDPKNAALEDLWIAGQPAGMLLDHAIQRSKQNADGIEDLKDSPMVANGGTVDNTEEIREEIDDKLEELNKATAAGGVAKKRSKLEKIESIIRHACSKDRSGVRGVQIEHGGVIAATGVSRQWAHTLMDEIGAKYPFASIKSPAGKKKQQRNGTAGRSAEDLIQVVYEYEHDE